jgi:hypothetical protein
MDGVVQSCPEFVTWIVTQASFSVTLGEVNHFGGFFDVTT